MAYYLMIKRLLAQTIHLQRAVESANNINRSYGVRLIRLQRVFSDCHFMYLNTQKEMGYIEEV